MANEILKGSVPAIPSAGAPITQVNQYGGRSVHADHVENLNVTVIENQGSPTEDENGVPFVPLTPTRYDSTTRIIYLEPKRLNCLFSLRRRAVFPRRNFRM